MYRTENMTPMVIPLKSAGYSDNLNKAATIIEAMNTFAAPRARAQQFALRSQLMTIGVVKTHAIAEPLYYSAVSVRAGVSTKSQATTSATKGDRSGNKRAGTSALIICAALTTGTALVGTAVIVVAGVKMIVVAAAKIAMVIPVPGAARGVATRAPGSKPATTAYG